MEVNHNVSPQPNEAEDIQIMDLVYLCLSKWYWFVASVVLCLLVAIFYMLMTPPVYTRSEEVQIKTDSRGHSTADLSQFQDLGLFSTNTNVYNEIKAFNSNVNMLEVVKRLNLDMNYVTAGRFHDNTLYGKSLPVNIQLLDLKDEDRSTFTIDVKSDGAVVLGSFTLNDELPFKESVLGIFADTLSTPIGRVLVNPTTFYVPEDYPTINVSRTTIRRAVSHYSSELNVSLSDKMSQVILLTISDISVQRAEDVLSTLVAVYNENWVADKNQMAVSTSQFINERLEVIEKELASVDSDISSYKSENLLPDVQAASNLYMSKSNEISSQIMDLNNQLYMTTYIKDYLQGSDKAQLLPANSGISNSNIEAQIREYNSTVLQRNNLVDNSSESNPLVLDLDKTIASLRQAIMTSVDNQILALNNQINSLQKTEKQATAKIAANPTQAKYLLTVERQQAVKEALYLFLLQKREENELSQAFTAYNTRIVDPPHGPSAPTSPRSSMVYLLALMMGLAIPFGVIYVTEVLNGKVRGRKDIKKLTMPFAGEIPLAFGKDNTARRIANAVKHGHETHEVTKLVVEPSNRNIINEAFRVLRTNVEFMGKKNDFNIIAMTSFNPGSGKSFITANLAMALAIKGKKVLGIDCDLRHASLSNYAKAKKLGFASYLSGQTDDLDGLLFHSSHSENLDILPVGSIPPNPSELVADERFAQALDYFKGKYDYIFLDCPPIDIVADTQIISQHATRTLFVLRAGLCERSMLSDLEGFYKQGRFNNLAIILNGTTVTKGGYFGYKYGFNYGAGYGSYGSYANDDKKKS